MPTVLRIAHIVSLVVALLVFGSGIPVARYLCPLMSDDANACPMMPTGGTADKSISSPTPDCCRKEIVAERNTTQFLNVERIGTGSLVASELPAVPYSLPVASPPAVTSWFAASSELRPPPQQLFLLNASLLL